MKTIRANCFETNSSSTHSVTIISKASGEADGGRPLEKDGVLYPQNLRWTNAYRAIEDGHSLHASTTAEKTALLLHHIKSLGWYSDHDKGTIQRVFDFVIDRVTNVYGVFTEVNIDNFKDGNFECSDEDGTYLDRIMGEGDDIEKIETDLDFFIRNTVMDNDKIIVDSDNPY